MRINTPNHCIRSRFLYPDLSRALQESKEVLSRVSKNPVGILMLELIEMHRERVLEEAARRTLFQRDYRSDVEKEVDRRAYLNEVEAQTRWKLGLEEEAYAYWRRADQFWALTDQLQEDREIWRAAKEKLFTSTPRRRTAR